MAGGDQAKVHTIRVDVAAGPVFFRIGTASGGEELISETKLSTGTHLLSFTPGVGTIYVRVRSEDPVTRTVSRIIFQHTLAGGAGTFTLPTPWALADLEFLAWDQSADVLYVGDGEVQPKQIERRGPKSWSIVPYETRNGPLQFPDTNKVSLTPSTFSINGDLTSNIPYFKPSHVGTLFELTHNEQHVIDQLHEKDQTTEYLTVRGLFSSTVTFDDRNFGYLFTFSGGAVMEIALERSTDAEAAVWTQVDTFSASAGPTAYNDEQSNIIAHYRVRCTSYTSGYCDVALTYLAGSTTGLVRITSYVSSTNVNYETIKTIGAVGPTRNWRGPQWSDDLGWPRVPRLFDGRLWWFRGGKAFGSIVDDYNNYDDTVEGDSAPVIRSIGSGPDEGARWALDMQRLIVGTSGFEASIRSSGLDEPITPTAFTVRNASTLGVSFVPAAKVDRGAIFAHRSNRRLYELMFSGETNDYTSQDVSRLNPGAFAGVIKRMAVQRQPDTRVYIVLEDGTAVVLTYERDDKVVAFTTITTPSGLLEDVCVLPADDQDDVFFIVNRSGTRTIERLAPEAEQKSAATCALLDGHSVLTGTIGSITGASRFEGQTVQVWADGQRRADRTISGGRQLSGLLILASSTGSTMMRSS